MTAPQCPLCQTTQVALHAVAQDIEYFTSADSFDYYRCDACRMVFIAPMPLDRLSKIYPANYYSFAATSKSVAVRVKEWLDQRQFRKLLGQFKGEELAVLDVGGGTGWLLDLVKATDARVTRTCVVDLDSNAAKVAEAAGHTYWHGRIEQVEIAERFDLVMMLNLIEHVADPRAVMAKARTLLKPGGRLLIKTPNYDALDARLFRHRSWGGYHAPRHWVLFCRESLETLAGECGLRTVSFGYTQGAPFWSVSLLEELRRLGLAKVSADRPSVYHPLMPLLQITSAAFDFLRAPFAKLSQMEILLEDAGTEI